MASNLVSRAVTVTALMAAGPGRTETLERQNVVRIDIRQRQRDYRHIGESVMPPGVVRGYNARDDAAKILFVS